MGRREWNPHLRASGSVLEVPGLQALAFAAAFALAERRLLWGAALFRWTRPLFTIESMTGWVSRRALRAASASPEATASDALRIAVRMRERAATLRVRFLTACRAAFSADLVFATLAISAIEACLEGRVVWAGMSRKSTKTAGWAGEKQAEPDSLPAR